MEVMFGVFEAVEFHVELTEVAKDLGDAVAVAEGAGEFHGFFEDAFGFFEAVGVVEGGAHQGAGEGNEGVAEGLTIGGLFEDVTGAQEVVVAAVKASSAQGSFGEVKEDFTLDFGALDFIEHGLEALADFYAAPGITLHQMNAGEADEGLGDALEVADVLAPVECLGVEVGGFVVAGLDGEEVSEAAVGAASFGSARGAGFADPAVVIFGETEFPEAPGEFGKGEVGFGPESGAVVLAFEEVD